MPQDKNKKHRSKLRTENVRFFRKSHFPIVPVNKCRSRQNGQNKKTSQEIEKNLFFFFLHPEFISRSHDDFCKNFSKNFFKLFEYFFDYLLSLRRAFECFVDEDALMKIRLWNETKKTHVCEEWEFPEKFELFRYAPARDLNWMRTYIFPLTAAIS